MSELINELLNDNNFSEESSSSKETPFSVQFEHFLKRTDVSYVTANLLYLVDRGIENRLLDNLLEYLPDGAIIAGGFALSVFQEDKNAKDIDFFFTSKEAYDKTIQLFLNPPDDAWAYKGYYLENSEEDTIEETSKKIQKLNKASETRYISFKHATRPHVQLLKMVWYDSADHVIDSFDFTIAQLAFTNKSFVFNPFAIMDISKKRIVLHRMQFPASTLRRLIKYSHKGYYACPGSLAKICEAVQTFNGPPDVQTVVYVD